VYNKNIDIICTDSFELSGIGHTDYELF